MEIITQNVIMAPFSLSGLDAIRFVFMQFQNFRISHFTQDIECPMAEDEFGCDWHLKSKIPAINSREELQT